MVTNYFHYHKWAMEGYEKYDKKGRSFITPGSWGCPDEFVVSRSQAKWMINLPDHILSDTAALNQYLFCEFNFLHKKFASNGQHARVLRRYLTRNLPSLIPDIQACAHRQVDRVLGTDTENWKTINVWKTWMSIVPPISNLILVGRPLCDNEKFLHSMVSFAEHCSLNILLLNLVPLWLQPVIARLFTIPNWWHWRTSSKYTLPLIKERLNAMKQKEAGNPEFKDWIEPEDFITWSIQLATMENDDSELDPVMISKRLLPLEFASFHTTILTGHSFLLDLVSSDPSCGYIEALREESARVLAEEGGQWTRNGLSRLYRLDSAMRESQRISNIATTIIHRKVVAEDGIKNPTENWHIPRGTIVTLSMHGIQHDQDLHSNPETYDAFRYSRLREEYEAQTDEAKSAEELAKMNRLGMTATSEDHLAFGYGRHACPGRYFASDELKLIMSHMILNYDFRPLAQRPKTGWFSNIVVPPIKASVQIKRRKTVTFS
ncbi:cytochrome P450 monooxygenase [Fusarium heterosporum]|uniref:Cytochrome P450 monooxygenase n=1 Tax=Fusarium heterosporum TaxID=42747 RepID=A0A8H5WTR8_FUSHE|nr:cytochrome P450 monooxygenase [Fusarium heterosporum]